MLVADGGSLMGNSLVRRFVETGTDVPTSDDLSCVRLEHHSASKRGRLLSVEPMPDRSNPVSEGESFDGVEPLVSIVVPVYNGERFLRASLDSILAQSYRRTEVIVVDDASTDGAPSIIATYAAADPRVRVHRQPENCGIFANINTGIGFARGELIAIHHSDDLYHPEMLGREVDFLRATPEVGAVFCLDAFIDEDGREYGRVELPVGIRGGEPLDFAAVLNGILRYQNVFIRGGSSLIRKAVYDEVGVFDPRYDLRADLDMWLRIAQRHPIAVIDEHLVWYRYGHDNSSARYDHLRTEPELSFSIVDDFVSNGSLVERDALAAHEGHRAEDLLLVAVNRYIVGALPAARATLARVRPLRILRTRRVKRCRLLVLWAALQALTRLPRSSFIANAFHRRWHAPRCRDLS
jgi:glycosyltransferase involved in cell wall biosynthesis